MNIEAKLLPDVRYIKGSSS